MKKKEKNGKKRQKETARPKIILTAEEYMKRITEDEG